MSKATSSLTGMKKREQIDAANKTVFLWAMVAAAALSLCAVVGYFLVKEIVFNGKIISAKNETLSTLNQSISNASELENNVKGLIANGDLAKVKANPGDSNYKVVLDALPVSSDSTVLGSSILQVILPKSGVKVESLTTMVDGVSNLELPVEGEAGAPVAVTMGTIPFSFTAQGDYKKLNVMLKDLELSIRPVSVKRLTIQGTGSQLEALVTGESYYSSEKTVELGMESVKP